MKGFLGAIIVFYSITVSAELNEARMPHWTSLEVLSVMANNGQESLSGAKLGVFKHTGDYSVGLSLTDYSGPTTKAKTYLASFSYSPDVKWSLAPTASLEWGISEFSSGNVATYSVLLGTGMKFTEKVWLLSGFNISNTPISSSVFVGIKVLSY